MYSVKICFVLAASSGIVFGLSLLVFADVATKIALVEIWNINGPWHEPLALDMFAENVARMRASLPVSELPVISVGVAIYVATASAFNFTVSILGWRDLGALRGIAIHLLLVGYYCVATIFATLLFMWTLHWLNFWAFLIILIAIEIRRRDERGTWLSF